MQAKKVHLQRFDLVFVCVTALKERYQFLAECGNYKCKKNNNSNNQFNLYLISNHSLDNYQQAESDTKDIKSYQLENIIIFLFLLDITLISFLKERWKTKYCSQSNNCRL